MSESSVNLAKFPTAGRKETDEAMNVMRDVLEQAKLNTVAVEYPVDFAGALAGVDVAITAVDGNSVRQLFGDNKIKRVQVDKTGGTATGVVLTNEKGETHATTIVVEFFKGVATLHVAAGAAGTVILGLTDVDSTGVTVTDTLTITLS